MIVGGRMVADETTEEIAHRALEVRVVTLEADLRTMGADVRWLREREERIDARADRRWNQIVGCLESGVGSMVQIVGGLLGSAPIRWALAAALITAIPGATGAIALMQSAGPALVTAISGGADVSPAP